MFIELNRLQDGRPILVNTDNITDIIPYVQGDDRGYKLADEKCHALVFQSGDETVYVRNTYEEIRKMLSWHKED